MIFKILKYIILIIILSVVGDRLLYSGLTYMRSHSTTGFGKISGILAKDKSYNGLIFGSSRASRHLSPDILGADYFNLGSDGMESLYQLGLIKILEFNNKLPKVAILTIDEIEWFSKSITNDVNHLSAYYDVPYIKQEINELGYSEKFKFLFKTYRYNGKVPSLIKNYVQGTGTNSNGYNPLKKSKSALERVKSMQKSNANISGKEINTDVFSTYQKMIHLLNINEVNVFIVKMPSLYNISLDSNEALDQAIQSLNAPVIDLKITNYNDFSLWEDLVHMNRFGAEKISKDILIQMNDF